MDYPGWNSKEILKLLILFEFCTCRFGPIRTMWCMRFESKHHYFKHIAQAMGNYINLPKSVAMRHQRYMCLMQSNCDEYLEDKVETGRGGLQKCCVHVRSCTLYK